MREQLPNGCIGLGARRQEITSAIVQRQPSIFDTTQYEGGGDRLGKPPSMKRRVHSSGHRAGHILTAVGVFPENAVGTNDGRREARNARLNSQRLEVLLKEIEDEPLRSRRRAHT